MIVAKLAPSTPSVSFDSIKSRIEDELDGKFNNKEPTIEYLARPDGSAALTHVFQIRNEEKSSWVEAFVDAHTGELLSVTDFVAHASVSNTIPSETRWRLRPFDLAVHCSSDQQKNHR